MAFVLWCGVASAQVSNLPQAIQKRLAEINPLYQSNIEKYGGETLDLFAPLLATEPKSGVKVFSDEAYGADPNQKLDVYQPQGAANLPVVVYFHGGALTTGDKNDRRGRSENGTSEISANALFIILLVTAFSASMRTTGSRRKTSIPPPRRM